MVSASMCRDGSSRWPRVSRSTSFSKKIFKPLGMIDTGFWVPEAKRSRLIDPPGRRSADTSRSGRHQADQTVLGRRRTGVDGSRLSAVLPDAAQRWRARRRAHAVIRNYPANDHERAATRHPLRRQHQRSWDHWGARPGGLALRSAAMQRGAGCPDRSAATPGSGASGSYFWVDPAEQLIAVQLIQVAAEKTVRSGDPFRNLTYGAFRVPDRAAPDLPRRLTIERMHSRPSRERTGSHRPARATNRRRREFGGLGIEIAMQKVSSRWCIRSATRLPPRRESSPTTSSRISTTRPPKAWTSTKRSRRCAGPSTRRFA